MLPSAAFADPIPDVVNWQFSMFCLCPSEPSQSSTTLAAVVCPAAVFSARRVKIPAARARAYGSSPCALVCSSTPRAAMSAEWAAASLSSAESSTSAGHPTFARSALTSSRTFRSAVVSAASASVVLSSAGVSSTVTLVPATAVTLPVSSVPSSLVTVTRSPTSAVLGGVLGWGPVVPPSSVPVVAGLPSGPGGCNTANMPLSSSSRLATQALLQALISPFSAVTTSPVAVTVCPVVGVAPELGAPDAESDGVVPDVGAADLGAELGVGLAVEDAVEGAVVSESE